MFHIYYYYFIRTLPELKNHLLLASLTIIPGSVILIGFNTLERSDLFNIPFSRITLDIDSPVFIAILAMQI